MDVEETRDLYVDATSSLDFLRKNPGLRRFLLGELKIDSSIMEHLIIKLSIFWFIARLALYNIFIASLHLSGITCSIFLFVMEFSYLLILFYSHIKYKYYRTRFISTAKILESISLCVLLGITFTLSLKSHKMWIGEQLIENPEPNSFLQNFSINVIMIAITLEIISAMI